MVVRISLKDQIKISQNKNAFMITRKKCRSCRYHKCLELGMSVKAIKVGRIPHEKKINFLIDKKI